MNFSVNILILDLNYSIKINYLKKTYIKYASSTKSANK